MDNRPNILTDILRSGESEQIALKVPDGPSITYEHLRRQVDRLSAALQSFGISSDHRVAMVLPNSLEGLIAFLAVSSVATAAPLNPGYKEDEIRFYLEDTNARAIIMPSQGSEAANSAADPSVLRIEVGIDRIGEVSLAANSVIGRDKGDEVTSESVAMVLHTSGTTSRPKRVPLTHGNLITSIRNIVATYRLSGEDVSLCIMPLFHVHGLLASTLSTLASGGTIVLPSRFNALGFWQMVAENDVTWFTGVPSMLQTLLARAQRARGDRPSTSDRLRFVRSCSSPLSPATMLGIEEWFGIPVLEAYGMTEASHQMSSNPLPPGKRVPGTVGAGTGVEIGIMDEQGLFLGQEARGEVVIRGGNVINAYEGNAEANAASFTNGWFRTGDEGQLDEQGYLTLTGRIKELINRSGEKISPREIDEVLMAHPAVAEAVAFAVPSTTHGEEPGVAVVLHQVVEEKELVAYCREHLADFKCPRRVYIVDELPKTATGKIQRRIVAASILGNTGNG